MKNPCIIWLFGTSESQKDNFAKAIVKELIQQGKSVEHVQGERDLDQVLFAAELLNKHGVIVVVSLSTSQQKPQELPNCMVINVDEMSLESIQKKIKTVLGSLDAVYSDDEEKALEERLRSLGYL